MPKFMKRFLREALLRFQIVLARCMAFYEWLKKGADDKGERCSKNHF